MPGVDAAILSFLKVLVELSPKFADWLGGLLEGDDKDAAFTKKVRDIMPVKSKSEEVAEELDKGS